MTDQYDDVSGKFDKAINKQENTKYILRLYIAGYTARSTQAIASIREICETRLKGRYELEVVDIGQQPDMAREEQIIATPTLVRILPLPLRRMIGNLSRTERVLVGLDLVEVAPK
jgi:circadian clock protein KaiB